MARQQTGSLRWAPTSATWMGRIRDAHGVRTAWCDLGTDNEVLAKQKLLQWIETGIAPRAKARERFGEAATRIVEAQRVAGFAGAAERAYRLAEFAVPMLGQLEVEQIEQHHLAAVLASMSGEYAADTVHHMRTDLSRVFKQLVSEGTLRHSVATGLEMPADVEHDARPRRCISDEHVVEFLRRRGTAGEIEMLVLLARWVGGQRTSDIHAGDWSHVDTVEWRTMLVRRPKTESKPGRKAGHRKGRRRASRSFEFVRHPIPADVREPLRAWHVAHGSPVSGPIFPARRGPNAGQRKASRGNSYAGRLRKALWQAGIVWPLPGYESATGDDRRQFCAYQVDTDESRRADFHSIRSAYITGLAKAGVNEQTAMLAAGHQGDRATHRGYLHVDEVAVPASALPMLALPAARALALPAPTEPPPSVPPPAPVPPPPAAPAPDASRLEAVLEALLARLGPGLSPAASPAVAPALSPPPAAPPAAPIDPARGSNEALPGPIDPEIPQSFQRRARVDSNHRHSAPEAVVDHPTARKGYDGHPSVGSASSPLEGVLTQALGQSIAAPSPLDALRAAAHAAVDARNWALLAALQPLVDAETDRARAAATPSPKVASLDAARAKREGGK